MTTFTAVTGSLKFTQPVGHGGDEFHPFPLNQLPLNEDSGTAGGLHSDFEVFVSPLDQHFFSQCLYFILVLLLNLF